MVSAQFGTRRTEHGTQKTALEKLRLAIQKSGRLTESSLDLIKKVGVRIPSAQKKLYTEASNFPLEVYFLRDDDIPGYVADGVADMGIVGQNILEEHHQDLEIVHKLGFGHCRLSIAVPRGDEYSNIEDLEGKDIATTYPNILKRYLEKAGVQASIHEISGSVEIAPGIGLSHAICDLVSSGSTLLSNGLKEVETVMRSESVAIKGSDLSPEREKILEDLLFRIQSVQKASSNKYILLNVRNEKIDEVVDLLPGMKSPTVMPLQEKGWSSLHSVVEEDRFWEVIEKLKLAGAEGILVVPIEKMII